MKRIPRIKFPQRHPQPSSSGPESQAVTEQKSKGARQISSLKSDVPRAPSSLGGGGKASLQPKRTPVSDGEIEAILLGGGV